MLDGIELADLRWLAPLVVGGACLIGAVIQVLRGGVAGWTATVVLVLSAALIGAGVLAKVSLNPQDGLVLEMAGNTARSVGSLEEAVRNNTTAIADLTERVNEIAAAAQSSSLGLGSPAFWRGIISDGESLQLDLARTKDILDSVARTNELTLDKFNELGLDQVR